MIQRVLEKVDEELNEFKHELNVKIIQKRRRSRRFTFALVNVLRKENINAEEALRKPIKNLKCIKTDLSPEFADLSLKIKKRCGKSKTIASINKQT